MSRDLEGEVALVTGAGGGIGRAVVDRYVAEGARVVAVDFLEDRLDAIRDAHGDAVRTVRGDVTKIADNKAAVAAAVDAFGKLDVLVGNAGITDGFRDFVDMDDETMEAAYEQIFDVNVRGYILREVRAAGAREEPRLHDLHAVQLVVLPGRRRAALRRQQARRPQGDAPARPRARTRHPRQRRLAGTQEDGHPHAGGVRQ
jgi:NAD(P)-dependent dehydrogenase (short-subunit alcohol dehydrogenase family)